MKENTAQAVELSHLTTKSTIVFRDNVRNLLQTFRVCG